MLKINNTGKVKFLQKFGIFLFRGLSFREIVSFLEMRHFLSVCDYKRKRSLARKILVISLVVMIMMEQNKSECLAMIVR